MTITTTFLSLYDGQQLLGTIEKVGLVHVARDAGGHEVGRYATRREASEALAHHGGSPRP
jgi:hypothetical protein